MQLFDTTHILYISISLVITIILLIICGLFVKKDWIKDLIFKIVSILVVAIHYSIVYVDFFKTGEVRGNNTLILPIYPCNIIMWFMVIIAFVRKKDTLFYRMLSEFTAIIGTFCVLFGILLNEIYVGSVGLADWDVLNGLLAHSVLLFGTLYLFVSGRVKFSVFNTLSVIAGLLFFVVDGLIINGLFSLFNINAVNSMYLQNNPFPEMPWINVGTIGIIAISVVFITTVIIEQITVKPEHRWYNKLKLLFSKHKQASKD